MKSVLSRVLLIHLTVVVFITSCRKSVDKNDMPGDTVGNVPDTTVPFHVTVATIAGKRGDHGNAEDGNGAGARLWNPGKMVYDKRNNLLYVADGTAIRTIDQQNNVKTYLPAGALSNFNDIEDIDIAPGAAGSLYFTAKENDLIRIEPAGNTFRLTKLIDRTYGGNATGPLNSADHLDLPYGIATGKNGEIYFLNSAWATIRRITFTGTGGLVEPFAGRPLPIRSNADGRDPWPYQDGQGESATFSTSITDIAADGSGNIYVADYRNDLVRKITPAGLVTSLFPYKSGYRIPKDGPIDVAQADYVSHVCTSYDGSLVFFTDYNGGGNNLPALRVVRPGKDVTTLVGSISTYKDGPGNDAGLATIGGIAATPDGKTVYVSEPGQKVIRKVTIQ
jgi:hypothetical protein